MPPMSCERAVFGLMIRPAANTPSSRGTRTSPVSASTRTSANWAPKAWRASCSRRLDVLGGVGRGLEPAGGHRAAVADALSRSARHALTTAEPHEAVPIEPPASRPAGRALSPISTRDPRRAATPSASAAIWVSTVRAPVPMSAAAIRTMKRAVRRAARARASTGAR